MRVSSLSDERVIDLVSKYFVPAWVSRDSYQQDKRSKDEQTELERIDGERAKRRLIGGSVCVFLLDSDGHILATQRVQEACKPENLVPLLKKTIAEKKLTPRDADAVRTSAAKPSSAKSKSEDGRLIHILARVDQKNNNRGVSNDRIELTAAECKAFVPAADARMGTSWNIPDKISHKLYQYCYPPGPRWKVKDSQVRKGTLKATLVSVSESEARIRLQGEMELSFPNTGKPTDGRITARFVGMAHVDAKKQMLTSLLLVSEQADYIWHWQGKPQPLKMRMAMELEP